MPAQCGRHIHQGEEWGLHMGDAAPRVKQAQPVEWSAIRRCEQETAGGAVTHFRVDAARFADRLCRAQSAALSQAQRPVDVHCQYWF